MVNDSYQVAKTRGVLEIGIPDSEAVSYQKSLEEITLSLTTMIMEVQTAITQQRDKAIEVSQQLENGCRPVCCAEARKASAPALLHDARPLVKLTGEYSVVLNAGYSKTICGKLPSVPPRPCAL